MARYTAQIVEPEGVEGVEVVVPTQETEVQQALGIKEATQVAHLTTHAQQVEAVLDRQVPMFQQTVGAPKEETVFRLLLLERRPLVVEVVEVRAIRQAGGGQEAPVEVEQELEEVG